MARRVKTPTPQPDDPDVAAQSHAEGDDAALAAEPEPEAPKVGLASVPVVLVAESPDAAPTEVGDRIGRDTRDATTSRVQVWLAETKYFLSTLQHEVAGEHGELIAHLRDKL